ncbi:MAG: hypothetical protein HND56_02900 [Pseudomonadota bacterium]|nr:hypothetical protein [Pseudomonadota bacterium]QKK04700.1 MAG: hypothetical protein HND56_02900 [Pseudomonadota bacterium]
MKQTRSQNNKPLGNENSYTEEFYDELFNMVNLDNQFTQNSLKRAIILAAQAYMSHYNEHLRQYPSHETKKELQKALRHIEKATTSLNKVFLTGNQGEDVVNALHEAISKNYPSLNGILKDTRRDNGQLFTVTSPMQSLKLLGAVADGIELTLNNYETKKTPNRSEALYIWMMIVAAQLEPIIGHRFEQSRYYKTDKGGEYISKKTIGDSELLLFIIQRLDPNVTISQIETAIKETRKERHEAPWDDYFPMM